MQLLVALCHSKPCTNQYIVYDAFRRGLELHGDSAIDVTGFDAIKKIDDCDAAVMISYPDLVELGYKFCDEPHMPRQQPFWSIINTFRGEVFKKCVQAKKRLICIDSGVLGFKRGFGVEDNIYQMGFDGIKGLGNYYNKDSPRDRWEALGLTLEDWNYTGVHIVVFGQVRWGVGSQHIDIKGWYRETLNRVFEATKTHRVLIRLHPNQQEEPFPVKNMNLRFSKNGHSLEDDIRKAFCTISFSSHSIVESVLRGRPSFCCSKLSMGHPLFYIDDVRQIIEKQQQMPCRDEVVQWLSDLCYTQWSVQEIKEGKAWSHLRPHTLKVEDVRFDNMLSKL